MPKRSTAKSVTIPPPVMGINTKDPLSEMGPLYAVEADNFYSDGSSVDLRKGSLRHATDCGTIAVTGLCELALPDGTNKLVALGDNGFSAAPIYNATAAGAATDISLSALDYTWLGANMINFRGKIFILGNDTFSKVYSWDGVAATVAGVGLTGAGLNLRTIGVYKSRLYFGSASSLVVYYLPANAIAGACANYDFQSLCSRGGYTVFAGPISRNQSLTDQYFCFITSKGEVLIYQGDNPAAVTWSLIGQYSIPEPCGLRSCFNYGGDVLVMTGQGLVSIAQIMQGEPQSQFLTDIISQMYRETIVLTSNTSNYCNGCWYPDGNLIVLNIPINDSGRPDTVQFVMNTVTGAWWKWTGLTARHFAVWDRKLVFGTKNGRVFQALIGYVDEDPDVSGGTLIRNIKLRPAYNYFGDRELKKQFVECRPIVYQSEGLSIALKADVDYENVAATGPITETGDTSYKLYRPTVVTNGVGYAASIRIDGTVEQKRMSLQATQVIFNDGDIV